MNRDGGAQAVIAEPTRANGAAPDVRPDRIRAAIEGLDPLRERRVLLVLAGDEEGAEAVLSLLDELRPGVQALVVDEERAVEFDERAPVDVLVLGPVVVRSVIGPLVRHPKLTELLVYLAMHPAGATTRTWSAALWPERRVPPQTVANRLSEARRALGFAPDGLPRLRRTGERFSVVDTPTDWDRFVALAGPSAPPSSWREALELVRGRPFDDLQQGQWVVLEGFAAEIEQAIVACALRLGEYELAERNGEGATWAARRGLRADPWDERLHRLLMRAADAVGNLAGVEATLRRLAAVLELEGDPLTGVHPETAALYSSLHGEMRPR